MLHGMRSIDRVLTPIVQKKGSFDPNDPGSQMDLVPESETELPSQKPADSRMDIRADSLEPKDVRTDLQEDRIV